MLYQATASRRNCSDRFILFFSRISLMRRAILSFFLIFSFSLFSPIKAQDTTCGIAWGPVTLLSLTDTNAHIPRIAAQGETLHVTWDFSNYYHLPYARSTDGGLTWDQPREMLGDTTKYTRIARDPFLLANNKAVFIIYVSSHGNGNTPVYCIKSTDAGTTWSEPIAISQDSSTRMSDATILGDTIIALHRPTPRRLIRSTNNGETWSLSQAFVERGVPQHTLTPGVLHEIFQDDRVTGGETYETLYKRSTNIGDTWSDSLVLSTIDEEYSRISAIGSTTDSKNRDNVFVTWRDTKYGCRTLVGCSIILRQSRDAGLTWEPETLMTELPNGFNNGMTQGQISSYQDRVGIVWTNDETRHINMRYSLNSGDSWSTICDVTPNGNATGNPTIAISPSSIHAVWQDNFMGFWGIYYRRGVLLPDDVREEMETPMEFSLEQNYPNPFNPTTTFSFVLRHSSFVTLKVYNMLGEEVAIIVQETMNPGTYSRLWEAKNLPSGIYIYRLNVFDKKNGLESITRKMAYVK